MERGWRDRHERTRLPVLMKGIGTLQLVRCPAVGVRFLCDEPSVSPAVLLGGMCVEGETPRARTRSITMTSEHRRAPRRYRHCGVALLGNLCLVFSACAGLAGQGAHAPPSPGLNSLTIHNGTSAFALVRIKAVNGATQQAELTIEAGQSRTCYLPNGHYYEVVRFGRTSDAFRYAKGEGFELSAPVGQYVEATLTLHGVPQGNYATFPATAADF